MQTENQTIPYGFIYKLTNKINGKCYIGQTVDVGNRFSKYKNLQCSGQPKIFRALKKYTPENFLFEVIDNTNTQEHADSLETHYIVLFNSIKNGYNIKEGGSRGLHSEATKAKLVAANLGRTFTKETIQKMSLSATGRKVTEETKVKISVANLNENNPMFGLHHTDETKQKISTTLFGRHLSEATKLKLSKSHTGRKFSEETKRKMSESIKASLARRKLLLA